MSAGGQETASMGYIAQLAHESQPLWDATSILTMGLFLTGLLAFFNMSIFLDY